ncbi:hypothetical protein PR048_015364 [Dryococelus australis]|uniref:Uncharacterized protein n=1 Tax=Dryococelus australis TaxID=614101 RepID=A0ABQ9HGX0_9NEOP|nr:hypothetical protein PR048_015364 [Dryococelus australis]
MGSCDPASPFKITKSPVHLVDAEKIPPGKIVLIPHEGKLEAAVNIVNMSRAEVEIPRSTQIAVLELLEKGDVLYCPCDVDKSVVSENMNQSGSLQGMKLCDNSGLDVTGKLCHLSGEDKQLLESLLQEEERFACHTFGPTPDIYGGSQALLYVTVSCGFSSANASTRHDRTASVRIHSAMRAK